MDGRGGCCIARHAGGTCVYDMSNMDRIMLRFRPIAPKPAVGGSVSPPENGAGVFAKTGRGKRRYNRDTRKAVNRKRKASSSSDQELRSDGSGSGSWSGSGGETDPIVTLPLLPETPVIGKPHDVMHGANMADLCFLSDTSARKAPPPVWLSFGRQRRTVESRVTVECLTDTWVDGNGLGSTDEERRINLERDTCPGFISDGAGRVRWTNKAYRKLVGQGDGETDEEVDMVVRVVMKERLGAIPYSPAFTCRVRVQYTCRNEMSSMTVPCDVWRMDGGGFAWRIDVDAALTLSLSPR